MRERERPLLVMFYPDDDLEIEEEQIKPRQITWTAQEYVLLHTRGGDPSTGWPRFPS